MEGIIIKGIGGFYYVRSEDGTIFETRACGRFRKEKVTPLVGDRVRLDESLGSVVEISERSCEFVRPPVSNITQMIVVFSTVSPKVDLRLVDTMLLYIESKGIKGAVCINKSDLDDAGNIEKIRRIYVSAGYPVIVTSAESGIGGEALRELLKDNISAFAGNSGVGKSSLLNLIDSDFSLQTGNVSEKIQRGKHTTRHVELLPLSFGGYVLDTPGFGKIDLPQLQPRQLEDYFKEFEPYKGNCKFTGCSHTKEKGCAVIDALEKGIISSSRHESYKEFYEKLREIKPWERKNGM